MTQKTFNGRSIQKHDTEANWNRTNNFIPKNGELIIYSDKNNMKMGNGSTNVKNLPFAIPDMQSIFDFFYPPGTIYSTDDANFNPNTAWGGSWEKIEGRVVIGANSTYPVKSTGGGTTTGGPSNNTSGESSGSTGGPSNNTSGGPSNNTSGGPSNNTSGSTAITTDQMPSHYHDELHWTKPDGAKFGVNGGTAGGGSFYFSYTNGNSQALFYSGYAGGGKGHTHTLSSHTHSLNSHTHSLNSHTHSLNSHTHTLSSHTHNITPPYYAAYIWKRIS